MRVNRYAGAVTILIGLLILLGAIALMALCIFILAKLVSQQAGDSRFKLFNQVMSFVVRRKR